MGCISYTYTPEKQIDYFFKELAIRKVTPKEYYKLAKASFNECHQSNKNLSFVFNVATFGALQSIEDLLAVRTCWIAEQRIGRYCKY